MGERNTIFGVGVFILAALTMSLAGTWFYYLLEGQAIEKQMAMEDGMIRDLNKLVDEQTGIPIQTKKVEEETAADKDKIDNPNEGLNTKISDTKGLVTTHYDEAGKKHQARVSKETARRDKVQKAVNSLGSACDLMTKSLVNLKKELAKYEAELKKEQDGLLTFKGEERGKTKDLRGEIMKIKGQVDILEQKLERMKERRKRLEQLHKDGTVLSSDPKTNMAVVDLGRRHGVRPGMVFDVFEAKRDGKMVRKGKVRLRRVESQQSFVVILAAREAPKVCPQCGWESTNITHLFCPYCLGGEEEREKEAQRLSEGRSTDRITAPEFLNPVKKGDFISSPFYLGRLKKRAFTFAIAGQPIDRSRQEIAMFLKENGCTLVSNINLDTDFAIVGTGPRVEGDMEKARKMGVSVLRESELFDFFGKLGTSPDALPEDEDL